MGASLSQWWSFLNRADVLAGVPLVVGGLALMLFGWRLWKICVVLCFGLIGAGLGARFAPSHNGVLLYPLVGAVLLGALSYWPARYSVAVLGGLIGAGLVAQVGSGSGLTGAPLWLITGVGFIGSLALSFINRRFVIIGVTAVLGGILLLSGLTVFSRCSPGLYGFLASATSDSSIVLPFILVVPSVVSVCYQAGETSCRGVEL